MCKLDVNEIDDGLMFKLKKVEGEKMKGMVVDEFGLIFIDYIAY